MATPGKGRKALLETIVILAMLGLMAIALDFIGIAPGGTRLGVREQTWALAAITAILAGCTFLFNTIPWDVLEINKGSRVLSRARTELILTMVSLTALVTAILMFIVEMLALWVFVQQQTGAADVGSVGAAFASNFVLVQTAMLLVYLLAILARENNPSSHEPKRAATIVANILTPLALVILALGSVMAGGFVDILGIQPRQSVYIVTLGVLLEFLAMRIRLRLPALWSMFRKAIEDARTAEEEYKETLRRRATRTYIIASVFVAASMAAIGAIASGRLVVPEGGSAVGIVTLYSIFAIVVMGLVLVRYLQSRADRKVSDDPDDELAGLVARRRRNPQEVFRIAVYSVLGFFAFGALVLCVMTGLDMMDWHKKYATDLFILAIILGAGPYGYFDNKERKRIAGIDEKFPDFLRDIAESARAGMTLPRALVTAAQGTYGALTPEIKVMAAQVEWGVAFGDAMQRFALRCQTPLIDRTVTLVIEAQKAGGSMVDILTAASDDAREIKQIVSERTAQMGMYNIVVYITYFVFIVVVLVLSLQFIPAFKSAVGVAGGSGGQQVGGLKFQDFDVEDFNTLFFQAAVIQAIGGGLVGGVLTKGSPTAGFMNTGIMLGVAWLAFRIGVGVLQADPAAAADAAAEAAPT